MTATFTPQIDATLEIKASASNAHLWLEEIITGDQHERIQLVWDKLDEAQWYINVLLSGGKNHEGNFLPLADKELLTAMQDVQKLFHKWKLLAYQRIELDKSVSGIGTDIDQQFDRMFKDLIEKADQVETMLKYEINKTLTEFLILQATLIIVSLLLFISLIYFLNKKDLINNLQFSELKYQEERLATTLNSIGDAVIATDNEHKITLINPVAEALTGWTFAQAKGKDLKQIFNIKNMNTGQVVENPVSKVLATGHICELASHTVLTNRNGTQYHIADSAAPIYSQNNEITGVILVFHDVTEEYRLQKQLTHHNKMDAIGHLAGGVAHDFNNILTAILGATQLLDNPQRNLDDKSQKYVKMIFDAANRAANLTSKLLAFGRKGAIISTAVDVHSIINDLVTIFQQTLDKSIKISATENAKSSCTAGDDSAIQNALMNLGINASQAMSNGGEIHIETKNVILDSDFCDKSPFNIDPGQFIEIEFRDTGSGIDSKHIDNIFEPFFTTKKQGKGTGLGLAAVYGTIREHKGLISVKSELGTGTVFKILLPCSYAATELPNEPKTITLGNQQLILVVDDEEVIRITCKMMLENMGYQILIAADGQEAIEIYQQHPKIKIVLMDMIMPKMNGQEAFYEMKKINPDCKVIIASGFTKENDISKMQKAGLVGFLKKPYSEYELSQIISENLSA